MSFPRLKQLVLLILVKTKADTKLRLLPTKALGRQTLENTKHSPQDPGNL